MALNNPQGYDSAWVGSFIVDGKEVVSDLGFIHNEKPTPITDNALLDDLVAYFKVDEASGSAVLNAVMPAPSLDGTLENGAVRTTSALPPAITFANAAALQTTKSSNNGVQVLDPAPNRLGSGIGLEVSVACWVYFTQLGGIRPHTIVLRGGNGPLNYGLLCNTNDTTDNKLQCVVALRNTDTLVSEFVFAIDSVALVTDTWYHVGMTFSLANGLRLYKDGVVVGTATPTLSGNLKMYTHPDADLGPLTIGYNPFAAQNGSSAIIDDVRIYSRELTGPQVTALAAGSDTSPSSSVSRYALAKKHIPNAQQVYVNGLRKLPLDDYTVTGCLATCEINFNSPLDISDVVAVDYAYRPSENP